MLVNGIFFAALLVLSGHTFVWASTTVTCTVGSNGEAVCSGACADACSGGCCASGTICCRVETSYESTAAPSTANLATALIVGIAVGSLLGLCVVIVLVVICVIKCKKANPPTGHPSVGPTTTGQTAIPMELKAGEEDDEKISENMPPSYEYAVSQATYSLPPEYDAKHPLPNYDDSSAD